MKKYVIKGKSEKEIIEKVANHFNVPVDFVKYEVLTKDKTFLGKLKEITVKVWIDKNEIQLNENISENKKEIKEEKNEIEENDELFYFNILKNGIFLMVNKELESNSSNERLLMKEIKKREIKEPDLENVKKAFNEKKGEYIKIADYYKDYYVDALLRCEIQKNNMEVIIEAHPPHRGNHVNKEQIMRALQQNGIMYGIDETAINKIVKEKIYNEAVVVAKGKPAERGIDAEIVNLFDTSNEVKIDKDEKGKADLKNLNLIINVNKGANLARKIFATEGIKGIDVLGVDIIPEPGKDKRFPIGKNTIVTEDGEYMIAEIDGQLVEVNGIISVLPIYRVSGNVDYSVGNIEFNGSVYVGGRVMEGFTIKAKGDVIVEEIVEDAIIESEGNIKVKQGILGREELKGYIKAEGNILAKFIQHSKIYSNGSVEAIENILHSEVSAKEEIKCMRGKGKIIGGKIIGGKSITAKYIGTEFGTATELNAGVYPEHMSRNEELEKEIKKIIKEKEKIDVDADALRMQEIQGKLDIKYRGVLLDLTKKQFEINKKLNELKKEKTKLNEILLEGKKGKIHIFNEAYPGTIIKIGENQLITKEIFKYATFYFDNEKQEISILPCEVGE